MNFKSLIKKFSGPAANKLLKESDFGLEREFLRFGEKGMISQKPHPKGLGSPLTHPQISTDFSEAQLELITDPYKSASSTLKALKDIHLAVNDSLDGEMLWPFSMPCRLPRDHKIPLAQYGDSHQGLKKTVYRHGLGIRYGRAMQTISGLHYNFAFKEKFWRKFYDISKSKKDFSQFLSETQFGMLRNFLRFNWLNTYLYGASPMLDKSYLKRNQKKLLRRHKRRSYYGQYATSLRMSKIGYSNKVSCQSAIRYDSLSSFVGKIRRDTSTAKPEYSKLGLYRDGQKIQLNTNILQIENEHYAFIRPKTALKPGETMIDGLSRRGVKYLELRSLDIHPYHPLGISEEYMNFLQVLITYCLLKPSPQFDKNTYCYAMGNQYDVAIKGRKPGLELRNESGRHLTLTRWGAQILREMSDVAKLLDKSYKTDRYSKVIAFQQEKIKHPELTPSAKILEAMLHSDMEYVDFGIEIAKHNQEKLNKSKLDAKTRRRFKEMAEKSLTDRARLETESTYYTEGYEDMEYSTQIVIKEALKRNVSVEVLDRHDNFIRLYRGSKSELLKQATKTAHDSYMSFLVMENKHVTKKILDEHGVKVPRGESFTELNRALDSYSKFANMSLVVKPQSTNFGIGIEFIDPQSPQQFERAMRAAFEHDKSVIVEEFLEGDEYRILVIDGRVVAITKRLPANVVGDGKSTIAKLVEIKNLKPKKLPKYKIQLGKTELENLKKQKLTLKSVPKKGKRIYFRQNSNVSTGGDAIDFTDKIDNSYKKIAVKAAKAVEANVCGIDMIIRNPKQKPNSKNHGIIELNFNPTLHIHKFPFEGKSQPVGKHMLDFLGF